MLPFPSFEELASSPLGLASSCELEGLVEALVEGPPEDGNLGDEASQYTSLF